MNTGQPTFRHSLEPAADTSDRLVLIADDDAMFRRILQTWLESWGYRTLIAEDGAQAWSILRHEHPPKLLILDWVMPGIDGTELCRRIRDQQRSPYQYILLATGKDDKRDVVTVWRRALTITSPSPLTAMNYEPDCESVGAFSRCNRI